MKKIYDFRTGKFFYYFVRWPDPVKLPIPLPFHGKGVYWWFWAKFDQTTLLRLVVYPVVILIFRLLCSKYDVALWIAVGETWGQFYNGTGTVSCVGSSACKKGFNFIDWGAGVIWWMVF